MEQLKLVHKAIEELIPYARNARLHSDSQVSQIANSIKEFGFTQPVLIDSSNELVAGHGRVLAASKLGIKLVPVVVLDNLSPKQIKAYRIADNKIALNSEWDDDLLAFELSELNDLSFDIELTGFDFSDLESLQSNEIEEKPPEEPSRKGSLSDKFGIPPFSVFNARSGWWQDRKKSWLDLGIESEVGRNDLLTFSDSSQPAWMYDEKRKYEKACGQKVNWKDFFDNNPEIASKKLSTTSIFDPVLTELCYRWFTPPAGRILDPFSGGSVRGLIASKLGYEYHGIDLRPEQIEANRKQTDLVGGISPTWYVGDSQNIKSIVSGEFDFMFSCPPYADLEVYSDDEADLSTMPYEEFVEAYKSIISKSVELLKPNSFAVFVVGEVRNKKGKYYNFVGDTVQAFIDAGMDYYNEAILVTQVGSLPMRAGRYFTKSRKFGKTHQNVLMFVKGDPVKATEKIGGVDFVITDEAQAA